MKRQIITILALTFAVSCASLSVKQRASNTHQIVHASLLAVDDSERLVCLPAPPPKSNTCTREPRLITDAKHQEVSRLLDQAYEVDIRLSRAIIAWVPGQPVPSDIASLSALANQIKAIAATLQPSGEVSGWIAKADEWLKALDALNISFRRVR